MPTIPIQFPDRTLEDPVYSAASTLREIIEANTSEMVSIGYRHFGGFPKDCCDHATNFLGHFLMHKKVCTLEQMTTPWNNIYQMDEEYGMSHGWIRIDRVLNVDISADQFTGVDDRVIVSPDHPFHQRFQRAEWVPFTEHHRRMTWYDDGEAFGLAWRIIQNASFA